MKEELGSGGGGLFEGGYERIERDLREGKGTPPPSLEAWWE